MCSNLFLLLLTCRCCCLLVRSYGVLWIRITQIMVHQRNRWTVSGFIVSFDTPWSEWSWITNPNPDHSKGIAPFIFSVASQIATLDMDFHGPSKTGFFLQVTGHRWHKTKEIRNKIRIRDCFKIQLTWYENKTMWKNTFPVNTMHFFNSTIFWNNKGTYV